MIKCAFAFERICVTKFAFDEFKFFSASSHLYCLPSVGACGQ